MDQFSWILRILRIEQPGSTKSFQKPSYIVKASQDSSIEDLSTTFQKLGESVNIDKAAQFDVNEATPLFIISQSLNNDDDATPEDYRTVYNFW